MSHDKKLPLIEKFGPTVQGEGAVIGQLTYFLRFGLCDYKCTMCDSMHAVDPIQVKNNAQWLTQREIADLFRPTHSMPTHLGVDMINWVTFSGGNPCIHNLAELTQILKTWGYKIAVETQGTFSPYWLKDCNVVTCSPKGPGMGEKFEASKFDTFCQSMAGHKGFNVKVVVFDDEDLKFAEWLARNFVSRGYSIDNFYLSQGNPFPPGHSPQAPDNMVEVLRQDYLRLLEKIQRRPLLAQAKFLPQWHVILWGNRQGV